MRAEHRTSSADDDALQYIAARGAGATRFAVNAQIRRVAVVLALARLIFLKTDCVLFNKEV